MYLRDRLVIGLLVATTVMVVGGVAQAGPDVDLGVQVRWRPESERLLVREGGGTTRIEGAQFLRTRVSATFAPDAKTYAKVMLQDDRVLGVPGSGGVPLAGSSDSNLGVQEAYLHISELFAPLLGLQAGRFQMRYGNERLVGPVGWSNPGRTFDAAKLIVGNDRWKLDIWKAKLVERFSGPNDSRDFYGAYLRLPERQVDAFALLDYDGRQLAASDDRVLQRWTLGTYSARTFAGSLDYIVNAAYQVGNQAVRIDTVDVSADISAYLVTAEVGYTTSGTTKVRLAGGIDLASGDNDSGDQDVNTFNNLYYTGHKFRGFMDQFLGANSAGLMDVMGRASIEPDPGLWLGADFHLFRTAEDYTSAKDGSATKSVGIEIDARARTKRLEHAVLELGGAAFVPSEDYAGGNNDTRLWGYLSVVVDLP